MRSAWVIVAVGAAIHASQLVRRPGRLSASLQALSPFAFVGIIVTALAVGVASWWWSRHDRSDVAAALRSPLAGLLVVAISMAPLMIGWQFGGHGPSPLPTARQNSVMASNVLFTNPDLSGVVGTIAAADPDVVVMSEVTPEHEADLLRRPLAEQYPFRRVPRGRSDLMVWSKFPFVERAPRTRTDVAVLDVAFPDGNVRIVAVHTQAPLFDAYLFNRDMNALSVEAEFDGPIVLLGDFNSGWFHPAFRQLLADADVRSAMREAGPLWALSWPTDTPLPPLAALDHVLVSDQLAVVNADYLDVPGSDHRAVVATIAAAG